MNPPLDSTLTKTTTPCVICLKAFAAQTEQTTCSESCAKGLRQQMEDARNMSREIQDLYNSYRVRELVKDSRMNY